MIKFRTVNSNMSPESQSSCDLSKNSSLKYERETNIRTIFNCWLHYFQARKWGLQMLIRMTFSEKVFFRHLILFFTGLIVSLTLLDTFISDTRAFIEFRTNILRKVNFTNFNNKKGSEKLWIPNYIHYIRLQQPEIRYFQVFFSFLLQLCSLVWVLVTQGKHTMKLICLSVINFKSP